MELPDRPRTPTYTHARTHTHVLTLRVLHSWALCPDEGVSNKKPKQEIQECRDGVCAFEFLFIQGAKHLLIHTIEQPEYFHFKLHNSEKRGCFPIIFTYIHTYPNNLNLFEDEIQCIVFVLHA